MKTKKINGLLLALGLLLNITTYAQIIPNERRVDWSQAGLLNAINEADFMVSVSDYGAVGDGYTNDSPAVEQAIAALNQSPGILFFPAGTYLLTQPLMAYSGLIIKGDGSESTILNFFLASDNQNAISISANQTAEFRPVTSGFSKGSSSISICSTAGLNIGDFVELREDNGDWDVVPIAWANHSVGQIMKITAMNDNELTFNQQLRISYEAFLNPQIRKINPIRDVKIENIHIKRVDEPTEGGGKNIFISYAVNCQISGVESEKSQGSHIYITASSNIYVFGNYLHDAFLYDGTDTRGYGITLNMHTGEVLVENNIFRNLRHAMVVKTGANGNVFSYNYSREPHRSEPISNYSADISVHGHYAFANLFDENICQNIFIDHYWGPGGPWNTFFRNRTELYGIIMTNNNLLETQKQNFVGNEISNSFPYGFFSLTGADHFVYGNNDGGTAIPAGTNNLDDISYYYSQRPWFLSSSIPFPAIGYPFELNQWSNPAKERYFSGGSMTAEVEETLGVSPSKRENSKDISITENPIRDVLRVRIHKDLGTINYAIYNIWGQLLIADKIAPFSRTYQVALANIPRGVYLIKFKNNTFIQTIKFEKQ